MRTIEEIIEEIGLNPDAPGHTQRAFIRHLIKHAEITRKQNCREKAEEKEPGEQNLTETSTQLSFNLK